MVRRVRSPSCLHTPSSAKQAIGVYDERRLLLGELPFDGLDERFRFWRHTGPETRYGVPVSCHEELFEVPLDWSGARCVGCLRGQVRIEPTLVLAVDVHFLEHGEGDAITPGAERGNLVSRPEFLLPELIAREP